IYASFTFIFFAIEAAILASALNALLGIPVAIGYVLCAIAVIPIVTLGITSISRFQIGTQPFWLLLQCLALIVVAWNEYSNFEGWVQAGPISDPTNNEFNLAYFGASVAILIAIVAQIGEQVDYLRFLPVKTQTNRKSWWFWLVLTGPGWVLIGTVKMLFGSFLAYLAVGQGASINQAADPTYMYQMVFNYLFSSPTIALILAGIMVIISQMKINVTNAYAGSIAWSNFFSRLTHNHPGRVVWLVFNVTIALLLMELGIYRALEAILGVFAIVAVSWLGSLAADLMINKPLGLSPSFVEFKRAHLYDINPVGVGSLVISSSIGLLSYIGVFGVTARSLSHFIALACCYIAVPAIAYFTGGRYYLARQSPELLAESKVSHPSGEELAVSHAEHECCICENTFEQEDMSYCPAYLGPICSLCCSLDSRCGDLCKTENSASETLINFLRPALPEFAEKLLNSWVSKFVTSLVTFSVLLALLLSLIYVQMDPSSPAETELLRNTLVTIYFIFLVITGVIAWLFLLAHESQSMAQKETFKQTERLTAEIEAHKVTDLQLQKAKDQAEQANSAKSRFLTGISHELRTPLQSILGYAQLLDRKQDLSAANHNALRIIRRSGEHLADLIEGLLDISKIEAGRLDIYRNSVRLPELINQLVLMFQDQATAKGLSFTCNIRDRLPEMVITDQRRLRQILINILSNAIKYTNEGSIEFSVKYRNQVAVFTVKDTGVGIKEEDLERILVPFERIRDPAVPNVPGTGLGLAIVQLLTDIMGGDLKIESEPGKGSTFTISLMMPWLSVPKVSLPSLQITGYTGKRRIVMVVDDEPIHRGFMSDLLSPLGFTVIEAYDAKNCLTLLQEVTPDIFLLDVSMPPGITGLELARQLRDKGYE
ncbi:MAG: response regulator, partial [Gammaproteobacteria bacterium]|nr:response regulator [Gammaproteobacteria bacterium]